MSRLLDELALLYGTATEGLLPHSFLVADLTRRNALRGKISEHTHVITSPPYINAQDYFRNFKLELHMLEGLMRFEISKLQSRIIGTERGDLVGGLDEAQVAAIDKRVPQMDKIENKSKRHADIVRRYFCDMRAAFLNVKDCLVSDGVMVVVCGDNLILGERIKTWEILLAEIESIGFKLFDSFADKIKDRLLAPKRSGHKGLIKEEIILAFRK